MKTYSQVVLGQYRSAARRRREGVCVSFYIIYESACLDRSVNGLEHTRLTLDILQEKISNNASLEVFLRQPLSLGLLSQPRPRTSHLELFQRACWTCSHSV